MAIVRKEKKKLGGGKHGVGGGFASRGGSAAETSSRRPAYVLKTPPCENACPNNNKIRTVLNSFILAEKRGISYDDILKDAWYTFTETTPFPAVCGRVCPHPCEGECNRKEKDGAVSINNIERSIGDYGIEHNLTHKKLTDEVYDEKIAIVGAGPAGLSCAFHLAKYGYKSTVFEALSEPGGMLRYGIPEYRLPYKDVLDKEIDKIKDMGVEIKCSTKIGQDISFDDLKKDYAATFVGIGAHKGKVLHVEGEDSENVFTGTNYLNRVNSGEKVEVGDNVVVIGGGDTAIDAARMAVRAGANTTILYRRTRVEMPAIEEEIEGALEEGVKIEYLVAPVSIKKDGDKAVSMLCQRMELGEPDDSGRRRPVPVEGSEFEVPTTAIIAAISQEPEFNGFNDYREGKDWIKVNDQGQVLVEGQIAESIFAGGDVLDLGLVIIAIAQGRLAAQAIHEKLRGIEHKEEEKPPVVKHDKMILSYYEGKERNKKEELPVEKRFENPTAEIAQSLTREQTIEDALRCMSCGMCFDCGTCWSFCQDGAIIKPLIAGGDYKFKLEFCKGCDKCAENCPCGYIEMH
jgi:NADPH-dependent glutamate synthase beta subunit-like oxidoreductase/Pyruvate/2-oxoacid:ferredoxin oxidoreductase delta subunit